MKDHEVLTSSDPTSKATRHGNTDPPNQSFKNVLLPPSLAPLITFIYSNEAIHKNQSVVLIETSSFTVSYRGWN